MTALMLASKYGHIDVVRVLLEDTNIFVNVPEWLGLDALDWATACDHEDIVRILLENGADVNHEAFEDGTTALLRATSMGLIDVVRSLVDSSDLNINHQDRYGNTALHRAYLNHNVEEAEFLLRHKFHPAIDLTITNVRDLILPLVCPHPFKRNERLRPCLQEEGLSGHQIKRVLLSPSTATNHPPSQATRIGHRYQDELDHYESIPRAEAEILQAVREATPLRPSLVLCRARGVDSNARGEVVN